MTRGSPADHLDEFGRVGAPAVVLVHGAMDRAESFGRLARRLRVDSRVVCYDRRGYGRSVDLDPPNTLDAHVADLADTLARCGPAVVFGHSLGGCVAMRLGAEHPDLVLAVATYEAPALWAPWWSDDLGSGWALAHRAMGGEAVAEGFMRRVIGDDQWDKLRPEVRDLRRREGVALLAELADAAEAPPPGPLPVPVVVAYGGASTPDHQRAAHELAVLLEAPLVRVEDAQHGAHLTHPDELAAVIRLARGLAGTA